MPTYEKLKGAVSLVSNTPGMPTGYGQQAEHLVEHLKRHGLEVASFSNYGLEGKIDTYQSKYGPVAHYPRGYTAYGIDTLKPYHEHFMSDKPDMRSMMLTLYDVWVYNEADLEGIDVASWVPLDHVTLPPAVEKFLRRDNVTPITMSPHGQRQLEEANIESTYIPHAIDTKVMRPNRQIQGVDIRDYYSVPEGDFLVGMVAANKANGQIHRKAFGENLLAFAMFKKEHPDAQLYIHSHPGKVYNGFNLANLIRAVGLTDKDVIFPDPELLRFGFSQNDLAALYTGMDVLLAPSYGEGFGVPTIEAQACGTRVIASDFAGSSDLVAEDGWKVQGQPFWDEAQISFFQIPSVPQITKALGEAYHAERGDSKTSIEFAKQFDVERVWNWYWMPFLRKKFA